MDYSLVIKSFTAFVALDGKRCRMRGKSSVVTRPFDKERLILNRLKTAVYTMLQIDNHLCSVLLCFRQNRAQPCQIYLQLEELFSTFENYFIAIFCFVLVGALWLLFRCEKFPYSLRVCSNNLVCSKPSFPLS